MEPGENKGPFQTYTVEQFMKTVTVAGGSFNKDETKLLVSSNESGVFNIYSLDMATGERAAITDSQDTTYALSYFPKDDRILFMRDRGGNELYHIYMRQPDGTITDLTGDAEVRETFVGFHPEEPFFYTLCNRRNPSFMDLYRYDNQTLERSLVYQSTKNMTIGDISYNGRWLTLERPITRQQTELYLLDLEKGGEPVRLHDETVANYGSLAFDREDQYLYYGTNQGHEFYYAMRYALDTGKHEVVRKEDWGLESLSFSRKGTYLSTLFNWDGSTRLEIKNVKTGEPLTLPDLPAGELSGIVFSPSEKWMRFHLVADNAPSNLYLYNLASKELKRLTNNLNPEINENHLVHSTLVRYPARDGLEIPGYLYRPVNATADAPVPALVMVHGGPGGQSRPVFNAYLQFLVNHGYAVFNVNNRGSSGYGKTFFAADDGKHGKEPLWDCIDARDYLRSQDWVDGNRIGIIGGSYGGYMTLAALAFEPESFEVGIDIFGVTNWLRTLRNIPPWWEAQRQALYKELGNPDTQEEMLRAISPVFHGDKITKPLLVLQGANDPRVVREESDDMVQAIRENGGEVEYIVFDDEGHGFSKNKNRITGWNAVLKFADKHLKNKDRNF